MMNEKIYCRLCNADMTNDISETKFNSIIDGIALHYCKECGVYGYEIVNRYNKWKCELNKDTSQINSENELRKIESFFKKTNGHFSIHFHNNFNYDESIIDAPILKNGKPIGIITSVTPKEVEGFIWEKYISIDTIFDDKHKPIAFEISN